MEVGTPIQSLPWDEADRHLGLVGLALRSAVQSALAVQQYDGRALMPLGDGLVAQVEVHETAEPLALEALLDGSEDGARTRNRSHWKLDLDVPSGFANINLAIPARVILLGEQLRVEVVFFGSPLFASANARTVTRAAELQRQEQEEEAERAARERDDDWRA